MADAPNDNSQKQTLPVPAYANTIGVARHAMDLTLIFGRPVLNLENLKNQDAQTVQPDATSIISSVTIPIGAAKDLELMLRKVIADHESEFGSITTPFMKKMENPNGGR